MQTIDSKELLNVAENAARAGGEVLRARFNGPRTVTHKGKIDLVTDADKAAEDAVMAVLKKAYPAHAVLAEEAGASGDSPYRWVIDPLDGTTNYAHGLGHFSVSIAVEYQGELRAGVIYDPLRDEMFSAALGFGATLNGKPLHVSTAQALDQSLLATGFPYWVHERPDGVLALFSAFLRRAQAIRRFGSAALDMAYVAAGRYDAYYEWGIKPWDIAAGVLLVREAGGLVTTLAGRPMTLGDDNLIASGLGIGEAMRQVAAGVPEAAR